MSNIKFLLHSDALSLRGDSTNAQSISTYLQQFFNIDSVIVAPQNERLNSIMRINDLRANGHNVKLYENQRELNRIAQRESVSHSYFLNSGRYSNLWIPETKHLVHAVFNWYEPHGDVYAYVSRWLYRKAIKVKRCRENSTIEFERALTKSPYGVSQECKITWVPHSVVVKHGDGQRFRNKFAIPDKFKIVGRIGGFNQFTDQAAIRGINRILKKRKDVKFVFINSHKFMQHSQIVYLPPLNDEDKWDFYAAGDVFLNGRAMGETFGFSIVEPLTVGKPVIAPDRIRHPRMDAAHMEILRPKSLTYFTSADFCRKVIRLIDDSIDSESLKFLVDQFSPKNTMKRFYSEFIQ